MRYLRSWLFDSGFVLIIAAPAAAAYFRSSRTYEISEPEALIHASYIDIGRALAAGRPLSAVGADSAQGRHGQSAGVRHCVDFIGPTPISRMTPSSLFPPSKCTVFL